MTEDTSLIEKKTATEETIAPRDLAGAPSATRHDLQLGRRFFHLASGVATATGYALFFTHDQVVRTFGSIACIIYIADRIRIAYPEVLALRAPWVNRTFMRAEEDVREAAMTPFAIAVLLAIIAVPKLAALIGIYTLAIADPLAAIIGIRFGRWRILHNRTAEGTFAFFSVSVAIAALVFHYGTMTSPPIIAGAAVGIGALAALGELLPLRVDDNLTIPIFVAFEAWIVAALIGIPLS